MLKSVDPQLAHQLCDKLTEGYGKQFYQNQIGEQQASNVRNLFFVRYHREHALELYSESDRITREFLANLSPEVQRHAGMSLVRIRLLSTLKSIQKKF